MIKKLLFLLVVGLFHAGCKVNPADSLFSFDYGKIYVTSNVTGAEILINNQSSGLFTPDTLKLNPGTYLISIVKDGYIRIDDSVDVQPNSYIEKNYTLQATALGKIILLEDFANVSCIPCVTSNTIIENLKHRYSSKDLIAIKYATNFPSPYDPFYTSNKELMDSKMSYYNIMLAPTIIINGTSRPTPSDSIMVTNKIDEERLQPAEFKIDVKDTIINNVYRINVTAYSLNNNLSYTNYVIRGYVVQEHIFFATAPGQSGETDFYNVVMEKFNEVPGTALLNSNANNPYTYSDEINISSSWNKEMLRAVIFIQDLNTKKVYQTGSTF